MKKMKVSDLMGNTDSIVEIDGEKLKEVTEMSEKLLVEIATKISEKFNIPYAFVLFGLGAHAAAMCDEFVVMEEEEKDMN
jgi:hypothetical protein